MGARRRRPGDATPIRGQQHHHSHRHSLAHQWRNEAAQRLSHEYHVLAVADRADHHVGVLGQARRVVVAREIDSHHVVPGRLQFGHHQVPVPRVRAGTRNEHE